MFTEQLKEVGLSAHEAAIYDYLAERGASTASTIARNTGIQRSTVYAVLNELQEAKLVMQTDTKKVARFSITNPEHLKNLIEQKTHELAKAETAYSAISEQLKQRHAIESGQPGVRFFDGLKGLQFVYNDLNTSDAKELWVVRSRIKPSEEMLALIREQRKRQTDRGIKVKVMNSTEDVDITKYLHQDENASTERRVVAGSVFKNPAQILIYANKVAITTYQDPMVTTLIEHGDIAETLRSLYSIVWQKTLAETKTFLNKHKNTTS